MGNSLHSRNVLGSQDTSIDNMERVEPFHYGTYKPAPGISSDDDDIPSEPSPCPVQGKNVILTQPFPVRRMMTCMNAFGQFYREILDVTIPVGSRVKVQGHDGLGTTYQSEMIDTHSFGKYVLCVSPHTQDTIFMPMRKYIEPDFRFSNSRGFYSCSTDQAVIKACWKPGRTNYWYIGFFTIQCE